MGRVAILNCPNCEHTTHLTQAESLISHALVVACSKCGSSMRRGHKSGWAHPPQKENPAEER